jgi:hypothetical protein
LKGFMIASIFFMVSPSRIKLGTASGYALSPNAIEMAGPIGPLKRRNG